MVKNGEKWAINRANFKKMSELPQMQQPYGDEFLKQLDDKRRVTIPAKWRFKGDDADNSYFAIATSYGSIEVLPPQRTAVLLENISKISIANPAKRKALARFLKNSCTFGCDKQGRVMLTEAILNHAGIKKEVCMVGMGSSFELWDPKRRDEWLNEDDDSIDEASLLEELGV